MKSLILLSAVIVVCHGQLWQMNSVPFLSRSYNPNPPPIVNPAMVQTPRLGNKAQPTLRGEFKALAQLEVKFKNEDGSYDTFPCAGTLISNNFVLTAAHCVRQRAVTAESVIITLGRWNMTADAEADAYTFIVPTESIIIHDYYGSANPTYDFALLRLPQPIPSKVSNTIQPLALPGPFFCTEDYIGSTYPVDNCKTVATTIGWGQDNIGIMQKTIVPTYYYQSCNVWKTARVFTEATLCAGGLSYGDVCLGNAGSPLMCRDEEDSWYLLGVASYGDPDCSSEAQGRLPAIYSRVCAALQWINLAMRRTRSPSALTTVIPFNYGSLQNTW